MQDLDYVHEYVLWLLHPIQCERARMSGLACIF